MHPGELRIENFTYQLPDERIARYPLASRDASKLLVYDQGNITSGTFTDLPDVLPENTLLVFNQTRVVNARLLFKKPGGGAIEIFCLEPDKQYSDITTAMAQKGQVWWHCLVGGAAKWKPGMVLGLEVPEHGFTVHAKIVARTLTNFIIELSWDHATFTFAEVLKAAGKIPLPPYLRRDAEESDADRYQTLFAKNEGSVAAPTASLHFTPAVMAELEKKKIQTALLTLHVGAGTFMPVKSETIAGHAMHEEWLEAGLTVISTIINHTGPVVAVGTTALRTLESLYWMGIKVLIQPDITMKDLCVTQWEPYKNSVNVPMPAALSALKAWLQKAARSTLITRTQILIAPGYQFRITDGLITNFHQPQSTLLLLVSALIGDDWKKVYDYALNHDYRFLSYGDSSLLWGRNRETEALNLNH